MKKDCALKNYTTFKIGGEAKALHFPSSKAELVELLQNIENPVVLGAMSNILASSDGIDKDVIITMNVNSYQRQLDEIEACCGVKGPYLSQVAHKAGLSGMEFMIGFPASVGGAVYMNSSCHNQAISDILLSCEVFDLDTKKVPTLSKSDMDFGYRTSCLKQKKLILLSAKFKLTQKDSDEIESLMQRNIDFRKKHQPNLSYPNAGSVFKNPENDSAGRLLDLVGAKELSVNDVYVWKNHANFIVNNGSGTSLDILHLMLKMQKLVYEKYTIKLVPEIEFFGGNNKEENQLWTELSS